MKIIDKRKFIRTFTIIGAILTLLILFSSKTYSNVNKKYKEEYIYNGDTLWEIAVKEKEENSYFKDEDIRNIIYEIKAINNLESADLYNGQKILIPTY